MGIYFGNLSECEPREWPGVWQFGALGVRGTFNPDLSKAGQHIPRGLRFPVLLSDDGLATRLGKTDGSGNQGRFFREN